jgi:hypothetical protein
VAGGAGPPAGLAAAVRCRGLLEQTPRGGDNATGGDLRRRRTFAAAPSGNRQATTDPGSRWQGIVVGASRHHLRRLIQRLSQTDRGSDDRAARATSPRTKEIS